MSDGPSHAREEMESGGIRVEGMRKAIPLASLPEDIRLFIYNVTLHLQSARGKTPEQHDAMFHDAYRLYDKYDVEGLRTKSPAPEATSETPRTTENLKKCSDFITRDHSYIEVVRADFARTLECENTALREQLAALSVKPETPASRVDEEVISILEAHTTHEDLVYASFAHKLAVENAALREAADGLVDNGYHSRECPRAYSKKPCDCGWHEAVLAFSELKNKQP